MGLRFKLDENMPRGAEEVLRAAGHDSDSALSQQLGGKPDDTVLDACRGDQRVLITFDLGFADIRLYPPASHYGVWVLRPVSQSVPSAITLIRRALALLESEPTEHRLWVIDEHRVRIRE